MAKPCSVAGCPNPHYCKGYCKKHYKKFVDNPTAKKKKAVEAAKSNQQHNTVTKKTNTGSITVSPQKMEALFLRKCQTEQELKNFTKYFFNLQLPDQTVSRYADSNPFNALWEMYNITVLENNPDDIRELIYVAGRGSGKTISVSLAQLLAVIHGQMDVVHVGAIENQARRAHEYIQKYILNERVAKIISPPKTPEEQKILRKNTTEKTVFNIRNENCTIEIVPCTLKSVNGPHVPLVTVDEVDTISGEGLKAYKDISGMLDSKRGKRPLRVNISTRKSRYGLMEQQISSAEKIGKTVRRWTALEFMQRCPDDRSGTQETTFYVSVDEGIAYTVEEWEKLPSSKRTDYEPTQAFEHCNKCPLLPWCRGDAKNQKSTSPMLKAVPEIAQKVLSEGPDWTSAQLFNLKPSVEGIIFKEYEEKTHVKTWNQMFKILTGKEFPGVCDHDMFVRTAQKMGLSFYAGMDFGWHNPNTVVILCVDNRENVYVIRCDGITYRSHPEWIAYVARKYHPIYRTSLYFPDPADPGDIVEMQKAGLPAHTNVDKGNISTGIQIIKKWLRAPMTAEPKIFFAADTCQPIMKEFQLYHYKTNSAGQITEDPDTENDHWLDALRYIFQSLFGKAQVIMSTGADIDLAKVVTPSGDLLKVPTAEEYAKIYSIPFNNEVNIDNLGKIGRLSELEEPEQETNGDGGFMWIL